MILQVSLRLGQDLILTLGKLSYVTYMESIQSECQFPKDIFETNVEIFKFISVYIVNKLLDLAFYKSPVEYKYPPPIISLSSSSSHC